MRRAPQDDEGNCSHCQTPDKAAATFRPRPRAAQSRKWRWSARYLLAASRKQRKLIRPMLHP
jgi:hypothetical protein